MAAHHHTKIWLVWKNLTDLTGLCAASQHRVLTSNWHNIFRKKSSHPTSASRLIWDQPTQGLLNVVESRKSWRCVDPAVLKLWELWTSVLINKMQVAWFISIRWYVANKRPDHRWKRHVLTFRSQFYILEWRQMRCCLRVKEDKWTVFCWSSVCSNPTGWIYISHWVKAGFPHVPVFLHVPLEKYWKPKGFPNKGSEATCQHVTLDFIWVFQNKEGENQCMPHF